VDPNLHPDIDFERREALYRTLDRLRTPAGVRDPHVEILPPGKRSAAPARLAGVMSGFQIVVSADLLDEPENVRAWNLARVLSWWTTPQARRWHWLLVALVPLAVIGGTGIVVALLADAPLVLLAIGALLLTAVMVVAVTRLLARCQRALDEGGRALLRAAGYPPPPTDEAPEPTP
jgi:hypothetical protein